jgi:hypothetical protein
MKSVIVLILFCLGYNAFALDSTMSFTVEELNKNDLIVGSGTDIATAKRVLQLQLRASGCYQPMVSTPEMYEKLKEYSFDLTSDNCVVILKSKQCDAGFSPRNMQANPNSSAAIVGENKYIICLKSSGKTGNPTKSDTTK